MGHPGLDHRECDTQYLVHVHDVRETSQQALVLAVGLQQEVEVFLRLLEVKGHVITRRSNKEAFHLVTWSLVNL